MPEIVADLMSKAVTIRAGQSVRAAAKQMKAKDTGFLVVVEHDRVVGVVTARDLIERVYAQGGTGDSQVRGACTESVIAVCPDDAVADVVQLLNHRQVRRLPVVRGAELVGVVSAKDLLKTWDGSPAGLEATHKHPSELIVPHRQFPTIRQRSRSSLAG